MSFVARFAYECKPAPSSPCGISLPASVGPRVAVTPADCVVVMPPPAPAPSKAGGPIKIRVKVKNRFVAALLGV